MLTALIPNDDARLHLSIASRISRKNKKNKIIILFLTKYELCCVNDNVVDVLFVFVCFVIKTRRNTFSSENDVLFCINTSDEGLRPNAYVT